MLEQYFANRKIKKFLSEIAKAMPQRYGGSHPYTEGQVLATVKEFGFSEDFNELALVVFCNSENHDKCGLSDELIKKYKGYGATYGATGGGCAGGVGCGDLGGGD